MARLSRIVRLRHGQGSARGAQAPRAVFCAALLLSIGAASAQPVADLGLWAALATDSTVQVVEAVADSVDLEPLATVAQDEPAAVIGPVAVPIVPASAADPDTTQNLRRLPLDLTVFGYYRFFGYGRNITEPYPNLAPFERAYGVGDGYREPMLSLTVAGRPNGRSSFGTELFIFNPYDGAEDFSANTISLNLGVNFYGNFRTEAGNYGIRAGGIHWYALSPFTIGVNQTLDRYSIFDRTPWEAVAGTAKYDNYFLTGQAAPGEERFAFQAFQGLILNGAQLPGGLGFDAFWGKTQPNGGLPNARTDGHRDGPRRGRRADLRGLLGRRARPPQLHHWRSHPEDVRPQPGRAELDLQLPYPR